MSVRWNEEEDVAKDRLSRVTNYVTRRRSLEEVWLRSDNSEPNWPVPLSSREGGTELTNEDAYFDWRSAERFLFGIDQLSEPELTTQQLMQAQIPWLRAEYGNQIDDMDSSPNRRETWISTLFTYVAKWCHLWEENNRNEFVITPLLALHKIVALDALGGFISMSDAVVIEGAADETTAPADLRKTLWPQIRETADWAMYRRNPNGSMSFELQAALASFAMNHLVGFSQLQSYSAHFSNSTTYHLIDPLAQALLDSNGCPILADAWLALVERFDAEINRDHVLAVLIPLTTKVGPNFWSRSRIGLRVVQRLANCKKPPADADTFMVVLDAIAASGIVEAAELKTDVSNSLR